MCNIHNLILFSHKKDAYYNMDELWKHAKWKKLDTKGHVYYDSIYVKCLE